MRLLLLFFPVIFPFIVFGQDAPGDLLAQLKSAPNDTNKVGLYGKIATNYMFTQPDSATYYINQGVVLAEKIKYKRGEAALRGQLGFLNEAHSNFDIATKHFKEGLAIFEEINDGNGMAKCYNGLGVVQGKQGNLKEATQYFLTALKHYRTNNNVPGIVQTYLKLGVVNEQSGDLDKALEYYTQAQKINTSPPNSNTSLGLLNNIGIVYAKMGEFTRSLKYFEEGIRQSDAPEDMGLYITLLTNAGNAYDNLNEKTKALSYHQQALEKARKYELPEEEARALINIASIQGETNVPRALITMDSALAIARQIGHGKLLAELYYDISGLYTDQKDYKNALINLEKYHSIKDSVFSIEKSHDIASMQANYELEESKVHIKDLKLNNQARTFERNIGIISAAGILIILLIGWSYWRKSRKLNNQLHESNDIKDKLFSIIGHDLRGPIGGIAQMLELLDEGDFSEADRKEIITELRKQGQISFEILNSMLTWGKTQLQGARVNMIEFNPKTIINKNIEVLRAQAQDKAIAITDRTDDYTKAFADPDHFDFVIRNLLSNAIKFTPTQGQIEIDAIPGNNKMMTFSVRDNGIGISKEKQRQFATSNLNLTLGTNGEKGNGIGLLLSKEFIQANQGDMWIESEEGKGTVFYFSLPQRTAN